MHTIDQFSHSSNQKQIYSSALPPWPWHVSSASFSWNRYFRRGFVIVFKRCPTKDGLYLYPLYRWTACFPIFVMKFTFPQLICQIQFRSLFFRWSKGRWSIWNGTVSPVASSHWLKTVPWVIFRICISPPPSIVIMYTKRTYALKNTCKK